MSQIFPDHYTSNQQFAATAFGIGSLLVMLVFFGWQAAVVFFVLTAAKTELRKAINKDIAR